VRPLFRRAISLRISTCKVFLYGRMRDNTSIFSSFGSLRQPLAKAGVSEGDMTDMADRDPAIPRFVRCAAWVEGTVGVVDSF